MGDRRMWEEGNPAPHSTVPMSHGRLLHRWRQQGPPPSPASSAVGEAKEAGGRGRVGRPMGIPSSVEGKPAVPTIAPPIAAPDAAGGYFLPTHAAIGHRPHPTPSRSPVPVRPGWGEKAMLRCGGKGWGDPLWGGANWHRWDAWCRGGWGPPACALFVRRCVARARSPVGGAAGGSKENEAAEKKG